MEPIKKHQTGLVLSTILAVVFFSFGLHLGEKRALSAQAAVIENKTAGQPLGVDFSPFWKAWNTINEKYVPVYATSTPVADEDKVWGAISGMVASLGDPYTTFFPPVESEIFESDIRGNFEGVGMELANQAGFLTVIAPLKDSPAERAGILPGDRILKIDDQDTTTISSDEAVTLIRGTKGTIVTFTVAREGKQAPFEVKVTRDTINIPTLDTKNLGNGIFKIDLYNFSATSPNLFRDALRQFVQSGDKKLILDLRGNPGGYLEAAINMASWFLPSGKVVVRENFGEGKEETVYRSQGYDVFKDGLPLVILVDGGSASASEILAGALKEQGKAILVGEKTFGKGSVQELVPVTDDTSLKVTIARWLTPNGISISNHGIEPDVEVKYTEADRDAKRDPALDKAIEILKTK